MIRFRLQSNFICRQNGTTVLRLKADFALSAIVQIINVKLSNV